ncbi:restriction endonuclease subunit S [Salmonella enterica subsp. enterica serovar Virginia]|uniref:Restriction endonuclease subunit S n=6 Tax=Salmonella enterica TaxID=28901 RepID=A0A3U7XP00_SALMU|nr:restriction endonuclease subunit S [Salmonella enterica]EBF8659780.1 restriction endonuclease subunit S [Salmonella enterica subsp. enterica serovar Saintpaul str. CFSAN000610]EBH8187323.1 restriction endonuclease subunit S [Salmonella enterica subsp. enterica serovar Typhimurium str. UK-1]ECH6071560.1 restriction endonuclease subunit S [Salmonella enterica subsp. enterica serovar Reading]EDC7374667.1 restriction endonuclease subunit S [Salmonella enterica subsp. enterica serovar Enteritidis
MAVEKLIVDHIDTWTTALQTRSTAGRGSSGKIDLYGIKKLRELILELAVRGKLVPQDPNDEPASVLLERIAAEKAELVKQGKIKKQKPLPEISEEEKSFELPVGWEWTTLNTLAEINPKIDVSDDEQDISFVPMPLISTKFDGSHDFEVRKWKEVKKGYTHFANGDIAIAKITPCFENSKAAIFSGLKNNVGVGTTELHVARPYSQAVNQQYLLLNFKSPGFLKTGESQMTGSAGQKRVPRNFFENYPLPFPPLQEQERIVNNFTQLMILCDQLEQHSLTSLDAHQQLVETLLTTLTDSQNADELAENWARISEHFDTLFTTEASIAALKQTILQLAVMGKLVPQDPNDEPASELLKRIAQEKAQLVKDGKMKKQKPLPPISDEEKPFELPIGWEWCRLGECINLISGQHLKPDEYEEECHGEMLPYITGPAEFGLISPTYSKYTNEKRAIAAKGDILITCKGAGLGKLNVADTNIAISRQLMAINVIRMNSEYLKIILDSMYGYFQSKGVGIAIPGISREDVMEPLIMLPPFEEQKRIMENLYKLNFLIEDIKFRIKSAQQTQLHLADALTDAAIN